MYLSQCYSIIVVICLTYIVEATQCDTSEGPENEFYEALGCREEQSCPLKYNCSMIKKTAEDDCYFRGKIYKSAQTAEDDCYFRGKIYKSAHRIPDAIESCRVHCRCDNGRTDCPAIDCPLRLTPGCFFVYKDNECCPEIVCRKLLVIF
ncbi:hypothetical protein QE152_g27283 [Popillia japonica]|uniref:VWFC domain-containing protein n=1 Tax=Popillia japonica TaxID=7064 RepID=A0AAW1JUW8_POPJA